MGYVVLNQTDGVMASPEVFPSKKEAKDFVEDFRKRFEKQGYYLTSNQKRIDPSNIRLEIKDVEGKEKLDKEVL